MHLKRPNELTFRSDKLPFLLKTYVVINHCPARPTGNRGKAITKKQNQMRAAYGSPSETVLIGKIPYRFYS